LGGELQRLVVILDGKVVMPICAMTGSPIVQSIGIIRIDRYRMIVGPICSSLQSGILL
jgi:hypothetical protein